MEYGLKDSDLEYIIKKISEFNEIERAVIFGSRAKGNFKPGSDIDVAIVGEDIDFDVIAKLHSLLEEQGPLPYMFDVVDYSHLNHEKLKDHIDRVGKAIYDKSENPSNEC